MPSRITVALGACALGTLLLAGAPRVGFAQTDYYNTDAGRPIRVEDAYAIERRALELQVAPLRLERPRAGAYRWGLEPELALGLLPRTQLEIGLPLVHAESRAGTRISALGGLDVRALYNLNAETQWPALAIAGEVVLPVGGLAPARAIPSLKAIATRTWPWARLHANAQITFANASDVAPLTNVTTHAPANAEFTRWMGGLAIDHTLALHSALLTAELVASQPLERLAATRWDAASGVRYQLSPRIAFDAGAGYRLRGDDPGWFLTSGAAIAVGLPRGGR
ncbi:MAG: hypothetical protein K2R93_11220 [Gemmatimonadaceae bacterium]|nr:hypothetical protein [Gemmatimonadaceae bacterium]